MNWHNMSIPETLKKLQTNVDKGLSDEEAKRRIEEFGSNTLTEKKKKSFLSKLLAQFNDFMIITLLIAAMISFGLSIIEGNADFTDSIIILVIVILNAILGLSQEAKAEKSLEALKNMSAPMARVKRNNKIVTINTKDVVPGDILILETGDFVPADARLISSSNLKLEESALTGESMAVEKDAKVTLKDNTLLSDRINMVLATTSVSYGHGIAVAVETGMSTEVGKIAEMILVDEENETPLQRKLSDVGKTLGTGAILICLAVFIIGTLHHIPAFEMFMTSVSLAVAAIPEGLPAIVTIMLAIGVQKMVKENAIVKKLPAVETLGCASVICSDKTGTLTQNKMTVIKLSDGVYALNPKDRESKFILSLGALCNNASLEENSNSFEAIGEPTEAAIVIAAANAGEIKGHLDKEFPRSFEIPFDSSRKLMTTIHKLQNGKYRVITKGAPDILIQKCTYSYDNGKVKSMNTSIKEKIRFYNYQMGEEALRVLAVAYKDLDSLPAKIKDTEIERDLIFSGLIGIMDPPRKEAKQAVMDCRQAGIKPVMVTGDHIITACAIAKELGILKSGEKAITGSELNKLSDNELSKNIYDYSVFARVTPEHKVRIVKAFQRNGAVVAMTGDGVNDAPALKTADIGCAMGKNGTDVAKGAADMILTDDNFATIVSAVKEGRGIYSNIIKSVHFLLSSNIGEILTIFIGIMLGWPSPLLAIHLLWVNLVTDSLPAIALGVDPPDKDLMKHKPRNPRKNLFADGLWWKIIIEGCMIGALALLAFSIGRNMFDKGNEPIIGRTMAFAVLSLSQLVHAFNMRSEHSIFKINIFGNKYLIGALIAGTALQTSVILIEPLSKIFKVTSLNIEQWIIVAVFSFIPIVLVEIQKWANVKDYDYIAEKPLFLQK